MSKENVEKFCGLGLNYTGEERWRSLDMGSSPTLGEAGFAGSVGWSNQGLELVITGY